MYLFDDRTISQLATYGVRDVTQLVSADTADSAAGRSYKPPVIHTFSKLKNFTKWAFLLTQCGASDPASSYVVWEIYLYRSYSGVVSIRVVKTIIVQLLQQISDCRQRQQSKEIPCQRASIRARSDSRRRQYRSGAGGNAVEAIKTRRSETSCDVRHHAFNLRAQTYRTCTF